MYIKDKVIVFIILSILSVLLIVFLFNVQTVDIPHYKKILIDLSVLEKNTSKINEQVIHAQQGALRNYDQMVHIFDELEDVLQRLMQEKYAIYAQDQHEINTQMGVLKTELKRLNLAVEYFLSANAVRNHSVIYLARQMRNFSMNSDACKNIQEINLAYRLMQEILFYSRWLEPESKAEIIELSSQLTRSRLPAGLDEKIKLIVAHARLVVHYTDLANMEVDIIFSSPVSETILYIRKQYLNRYQQDMDLVRNIGIAVWVLCVLLILLQILVIRSRSPKLSLPR